MDNALQALLSWQFVLFCLGIATITYIMRVVAEYLMSLHLGFDKNSTLWNNLVMPLSPIIIGVGGALLAKKYPYPDGMTTISARIVFGLVAGMLSNIVYRVVKSFLMGKASSYLNNQQAPTTNTNIVTTTNINEGDVSASRSDTANNG